LPDRILNRWLVDRFNGVKREFTTRP